MVGTQRTERERARLCFAQAARQKFRFLQAFGFVVDGDEVTLLRYRKPDLEAVVYLGRSSFETGFEIIRAGSRYGMSALIDATDPDAAKGYRSYAASSPETVAEGLERLADWVMTYAVSALRGEPEAFALLDERRAVWSEALQLDVLASQVRPKAHAAFLAGDYRRVVDLYEKIQARLTFVEQKKLAVARKRSGL